MAEEKLNNDKKEHLKMIQEIIKRMANNSFLIKGWTISLISVIAIFADLKNDFSFILIAILPVFIFWMLDAYYLQQERKYRKLYSCVQQDYINSSNKVELFDMATTKIEVACLFRIMFTISICPIYTTIIIATIVSLCFIL